MFGSLRKKMWRNKALKFYKKGLEKAEAKNLDGAIADYTIILDMAEAPGDVKAMARLNRALARSSNREYSLADRDLREVLADMQAREQVKEAARLKLNRLKRRIDESHGEDDE